MPHATNYPMINITRNRRHRSLLHLRRRAQYALPEWTETHDDSQVTPRYTRPTTDRPGRQPARSGTGVEHAIRNERPAPPGAFSRLARSHHRRSVRGVKRNGWRVVMASGEVRRREHTPRHVFHHSCPGAVGDRPATEHRVHHVG